MANSATIVITTKDRCETLRETLTSALAQTCRAEILVMDDGSTDGTAEMIRTHFPSVRLVRSEQSLGCVVQRNRAARIATGAILISLDDDAFFTTPRTVEQTLGEFDGERIGAVAMPLLEPKKSPLLRQQAPAGNGVFVTDTFIGTAYAIRKDVFLQVGGYRDCLVHQGEERDFCQRMLELGYVVRLGRADPIQHVESPKRDVWRMSFYGRRNDILFAWHNVPWPYLPGHLLGTTWNGGQAAWQTGPTVPMLLGLARGYLDCLFHWRKRRPVSGAIYQMGRLLRKKGPRPLQEVEARLK